MADSRTPTGSTASAPGGADAMTDFFLGLQVWGTPERCYQTIVDNQKRLGSDRFVGVFSYAGMSPAELDAAIQGRLAGLYRRYN